MLLHALRSSVNCRCVIGAECSIVGQERPHDPGVLVRQGDRRHVLVAPCHQFAQPALRLCLVLGKADDGSRTVDHQGAQVSVATLADAQQGLFATTGMLPGYRIVQYLHGR